MNGNVFIGWCGSNELAAKVSKILSKHNYWCVVGGNYDEVSNIYIGGTIIEQLNKCNQALFIVRKNASGSISNNVIFEIGYSLSKFNSSPNKLHLFYLDIDPKDNSIPSDLLGAWAEHINTSSKSEDEIVELIVSSFLSDQKMQIIENKMDLVNDWHRINNMVINHCKTPVCSDFEMAQYLLFYAVSSGFMNIFQEMKEPLSVLRRNVDERSDELFNTYRLANVIYEAGCSVKRFENKGYLEDSAYFQATDALSELIDWVEKYVSDKTGGTSDFPVWFNMVAKQRYGYLCMMYVNNPDLSEEEIKEGYEEAIRYSEETVTLCDTLRNMDPKSNRELASLYKSFALRNIAIAYGCLGKPDLEREYKCRSFEEKKFIREYSKDLDMDTRIADAFERGYYLSMAEIVKYETDPRKKRAFTKEIKAYTDYMLTVRDSSNQYVNRIKLMMESNETSGV